MLDGARHRDLSGRHAADHGGASRPPWPWCSRWAKTASMAVVSQLDPRVDVPGPEDLYEVGTVCVMHKAIRVPRENLLLFCEGIARIRTRDFTSTEPFLQGARGAHRRDSNRRSSPRSRPCGKTWSACSSRSWPPRRTSRTTSATSAGISPSRAAWPISWPATCRPWPSRAPAASRAARRRRAPTEMHRHLTRELELVELRGRIQSQVQGQLSQSQREFYLREQLKAIQKELGEGDDSPTRRGGPPQEAGSRRPCRKRSRPKPCAS